MLGFGRRKAPAAREEWIVVARLSDVDGQADLAVSKLEANGIPVMRFPFASVANPYVGLTGG